MKSKKPKGKTPSLIGSTNGCPRKITIERKSKCYRCDCDIEVNHSCFGIPKIGSGFSSMKRHCKACFERILAQTHEDLEQLYNLLKI